MSDLPEPLTPVDCDLRGLPFMPLDVIRLLDSDFFAISTGDQFKAAVALWCKAWQQVPAGSLPDDDRVLAHHSGANGKWSKVKEAALRGWIKCSDGRLYHPTVAEKAIEALPKRQEYQERKSSSAERKARERDDRKALFSLLRANGITPEYDTPTRRLRELAAPFQSQGKVTEPVTPVTPPVTAKTGTGKGKENPPNPPKPAELPADVRAVMEAGGFVTPPSDLGLLRTWKGLGADFDQDVLPVVRAVSRSVRERSGRAPFKLQLFDQPIREKLATDAAEIERLRATRRRLESSGGEVH